MLHRLQQVFYLGVALLCLAMTAVSLVSILVQLHPHLVSSSDFSVWRDHLVRLVRWL